MAQNDVNNTNNTLEFYRLVKDCIEETLENSCQNFCHGRDIREDIIWISGNIIINYPNHELQKFAKDIGLKVKKKWNQTKLLTKIFKRLLNIQQNTYEGIWLYTFIIKNMELFLLLHCSDEDFDEDKIHGEFFSENDYPPENIALMYRCINIDKYHDYYRDNQNIIKSNIAKLKNNVFPYLKQDKLCTEILELRTKISQLNQEKEKLSVKLKTEQLKTRELTDKLSQINREVKENTTRTTREVEQYINTIKDLKIKIKNLQTTNNKLSQKRRQTDRKPTDDLRGIVVWQNGSCQIATPKQFIPVSSKELRENRLLNGDSVLIRNQDPLDLVLIKPSDDRLTGEGVIKCVNDYYIVDREIPVIIGHTSEYLPVNCNAQISYTPNGIGVVDRIINAPEEEKQEISHNPVNINTVYVAGGVKESIYRDVIPVNLIWTSSAERRLEIILSNVQKADVVFVITPYFSHVPYQHIKNACKKYNKPLVYVGTTGQSGFLEAYNNFAKKQVVENVS